MKKTLLLAAALMAAGAAQAQGASYAIDPTHTFVTFEVTHFGTSTNRGRFDKKSGTINFDRAAKAGVAPAGLDVVAATVLKREQLREYVERVGPTDEAERARAYQRMKRQRSRAMKRLRELLDTSPAPPPSGF